MPGGVREEARGEGGLVHVSPHPSRRLSHLKLHATLADKFSEHSVT